MQIVGGRQREIQVWVDPTRCALTTLRSREVANAVRTQNMEVPGGRVEEGTRELTVRTMGRIVDAAEFNNLVVGEPRDLCGETQRHWLCRRRRRRATHRSAAEWPAGRDAGYLETVRTEHSRGRGRGQGASAES